MPDCVGLSVLSSHGHTLLIGFFGDFFGETQFFKAVCIHPLMSPRARDEPCAKHRLGVLLGWLPGQSSVCALSQTVFPWLVLGLPGEEMEVAGPPNSESLTSRTRCVWGNTVVPEHPIEQDLSIAKPCRPKQVHSTFRGASSVPSPCFLGGTSVPAFLHRLVC